MIAGNHGHVILYFTEDHNEQPRLNKPLSFQIPNMLLNTYKGSLQLHISSGQLAVKRPPQTVLVGRQPPPHRTVPVGRQQLLQQYFQMPHPLINHF